jgi:hypothetical protein
MGRHSSCAAQIIAERSVEINWGRDQSEDRERHAG